MSFASSFLSVPAIRCLFVSSHSTRSRRSCLLLSFRYSTRSIFSLCVFLAFLSPWRKRRNAPNSTTRAPVITMHIIRMLSLFFSSDKITVVGRGVGLLVGLFVMRVVFRSSSFVGTSKDIVVRSSASTSMKALAVPAARFLRSFTNPTGSLLIESSATSPRFKSSGSGGRSPGREDGRYSPVITIEKSRALEPVGRRRWRSKGDDTTQNTPTTIALTLEIPLSKAFAPRAAMPRTESAMVSISALFPK
mmetsp:Transcript_15854/g.38108  ORF Transcript_15854/g.38108 Transcript_15854/m.38108 type:complete len:248 (+) Transcript_15854:203-946(+)